MIARSEIESAKERLRIPELWHLLALPGEPSKSCRAPYREDRKPSFSIYDDGRRAHDFATGDNLDAIDFLGKIRGVTNGEAVRQFLELANGVPCEPAPDRRTPKPRDRPKPNLTMLRRGYTRELHVLAARRSLQLKAVELAQDMGVLRFGEVCGLDSWVVKDSSGLCAEARRLDGNCFPQIGHLGERKAHTIRNSRKSWPVGILPAEPYRKSSDVIALVEGGPDLLSVIHFALKQHRVGILPVAILGRGVCRHGLHPDSLAAAGWKVNRFYGGSGSPHPRYKNLISYAWHEVAQKVRKHQIIVSDNQALIAQLSSRRVKYAQDGRLWLENKQDMPERGVGSPDLADAFVMAFAMQPFKAYPWAPVTNNWAEISKKHGWQYSGDSSEEFDESYADRRTWNRPAAYDDSTAGFGGCHSIW